MQRVLLGKVFLSQPHRVELHLIRELIQRRLQRKQARRFTGGAHDRRGGDVDLDQLIDRLHVGAAIQIA